MELKVGDKIFMKHTPIFDNGSYGRTMSRIAIITKIDDSGKITAETADNIEVTLDLTHSNVTMRKFWVR